MTPADRVDLTADLSCSKAPHGQRVRRLTSGWSGRCGNSPGQVAADLGQEPALAAAAEQVPGHRDREKFGIGAGRGGTGTVRDAQGARLDRVINQAVDVDE